MLLNLTQQGDKLLFAGMAGGKCVTTACKCRNTIGGYSVTLPCGNRCLMRWRGSAHGSLVQRELSKIFDF